MKFSTGSVTISARRFGFGNTEIFQIRDAQCELYLTWTFKSFSINSIFESFKHTDNDNNQKHRYN